MANYEIAMSEIEPQDVLAITYTTDINHTEVTFVGAAEVSEPIRTNPLLSRTTP
jgi:hypothetical protein